jgi:hypothetical protein
MPSCGGILWWRCCWPAVAAAGKTLWRDRRRRGAAARRHLRRHVGAPGDTRVSGAFRASVRIPDTIGDEAVRALLTGMLTTVEPGSARHLALVEAVRRLYQRICMAADRADKERSAGRS